MDVFLVNGNSCSMAARPLTAPSKPAVFQEPRKPALKPMNHKKNMKKVEAGRKCSVSLESSQLHWDEAADVSQYFIRVNISL